MTPIETSTELKSVLKSIYTYVCRKHGRIEWHNFNVVQFKPGNWRRPDGKYDGKDGVACTVIVVKAGGKHYRFIYDLENEELFFMNNEAPRQ